MTSTTLARPTSHQVHTGTAAAWIVLTAGVSAVFAFAVGYYALHFLAETLALGLQ